MKPLFTSYIRRTILMAVNLLSTSRGYENNFTRFGKKKLLGLLGVQAGDRLETQTGLFIYDGKNTYIGTNVVIGANTQIWDYSHVHIGDNFLGSKNLTIIAGTHSTSDFSNQPGPIRIGSGVWVGVNVTICGPVTIEDGAIIGAGAVVLKDVPKYSIAGGIPAKVIGKRQVPT